MTFVDDLVAEAPAPDLADHLALFGRFVGQWHVENELYTPATGEWASSTLRWTFSWILQGRGIQDVLVTDSGRVVGTTVRTFDAVAGWRVVWFSPIVPEHCVLNARAEGAGGIVLEGRQADGRAIRWEFSVIAQDSFAWNGWCSDDDGATWWHEQRMRVRRAAPAATPATG